MAGFMQNVENEIEKGNPMDQEEVNTTLDSFLGKKISSPSKQKIAFQASTTSSLAPQGHTQDGNRKAAAGFASRQMSPSVTPKAAPAAVEYATLPKPPANRTNTGTLNDLIGFQQETDDIQGLHTGADDNTDRNDNPTKDSDVVHDSSEKEGLSQDGSKEQKQQKPVTAAASASIVWMPFQVFIFLVGILAILVVLVPIIIILSGFAELYSLKIDGRTP